MNGSFEARSLVDHPFWMRQREDRGGNPQSQIKVALRNSKFLFPTIGMATNASVSLDLKAFGS